MDGPDGASPDGAGAGGHPAPDASGPPGAPFAHKGSGEAKGTPLCLFNFMPGPAAEVRLEGIARGGPGPFGQALFSRAPGGAFQHQPFQRRGAGGRLGPGDRGGH